MKQQLLVLFSLVLFALEGEGRRIPREHDVQKRDGDPWQIRAFWDTCLSKRITVEIYDIGTTHVRVNIQIKENATGSIQVDTDMELTGNTTMGSDSFQVDMSNKTFKIVWTDNDDANRNGEIIVEKCGNIYGDPHMRTFSGAKFNFQGHCSYTLVKDCRQNQPSFDISGTFRGRYNPREAPTRMVAVTTRVRGGHEYTFQDDNSILVNGLPVPDSHVTIGNNAGHIQAKEGITVLYLQENEITVEWVGKKHEVSVSFGNKELVGKLCGILGDGTSVKGHDLVKSDGTKTFNTTEFAESWVIPESCI